MIDAGSQITSIVCHMLTDPDIKDMYSRKQRLRDNAHINIWHDEILKPLDS